MRFASHPPIRTKADVEAIERVPLAEAIRVWTTYDLIADSARDFADKPAFHFLRDGTPDETPLTVSYAALGARMRQAANAFHRLGVGAGDTIAYLLPNRPETIYTLLGGTVLCAVAPINWMLEPGHIVHILAAVRAKILVVDDGVEISAKVEAVLPLLADPPLVVRAGELLAVMDRERGDALSFDRAIRPDDVALYLHTGGTTGRPKLAKLPHRGIAYHCWANAVAKALTHDDVLYAGGPLYHSGGIILDVFST